MSVLTKGTIHEKLVKYYMAQYGLQKTDIFYEQPAVNVMIFRRNNKTIAIKCHIVTGEITEYTEGD